jgi:hypothetical protein
MCVITYTTKLCNNKWVVQPCRLNRPTYQNNLYIVYNDAT